ncbi:hypothetical protein PLESTB_000106500 [Pleodorina starrii]|uniref:Uncharacterized protein n=1 Tax=Pleodorina starrii TaxID=330485 RepID=A0A9W6BB35_9CHLO|nr:hypothetical protein PLESTB_000106500 [Pleodorina starrii]GLC71835.1 hypothetical protein PLESTF_001172200 [Pleodorina starrii]
MKEAQTKRKLSRILQPVARTSFQVGGEGAASTSSAAAAAAAAAVAVAGSPQRTPSPMMLLSRSPSPAAKEGRNSRRLSVLSKAMSLQQYLQLQPVLMGTKPLTTEVIKPEDGSGRTSPAQLLFTSYDPAAKSRCQSPAADNVSSGNITEKALPVNVQNAGVRRYKVSGAAPPVAAPPTPAAAPPAQDTRRAGLEQGSSPGARGLEPWLQRGSPAGDELSSQTGITIEAAPDSGVKRPALRSMKVALPDYDDSSELRGSAGPGASGGGDGGRCLGGGGGGGRPVAEATETLPYTAASSGYSRENGHGGNGGSGSWWPNPSLFRAPPGSQLRLPPSVTSVTARLSSRFQWTRSESRSYGGTRAGDDRGSSSSGPYGVVMHYNVLAVGSGLLDGFGEAPEAEESTESARVAKALLQPMAPLLDSQSRPPSASSRWQDKSQQTSFRLTHGHALRTTNFMMTNSEDIESGDTYGGGGPPGGGQRFHSHVVVISDSSKGGARDVPEGGGSFPESPFSLPGAATRIPRGPSEVQQQGLKGLDERSYGGGLQQLPTRSQQLEQDVVKGATPPDGVDRRLVPLYPGKQVPMYMLRYRPGCWPLRYRITPPVYVLARFEFLFELGIGGEGTGRQHNRETMAVLSIEVANITHKVFLAVFFALLGLHARSVLQLVLLVLLQTVMVVYVTVWRPYQEWQRQVVESLCYGLVLVIFVCAFVLIDSKPDNDAPTTWIMIACFFLSALSVITYELWHMLISLAGLFQKAKGWIKEKLEKLRGGRQQQQQQQQQQHAAGQSCAIEEMECGGGDGAATASTSAASAGATAHGNALAMRANANATEGPSSVTAADNKDAGRSSMSVNEGSSGGATLLQARSTAMPPSPRLLEPLPEAVRLRASTALGAPPAFLLTPRSGGPPPAALGTSAASKVAPLPDPAPSHAPLPPTVLPAFVSRHPGNPAAALGALASKVAPLSDPAPSRAARPVNRRPGRSSLMASAPNNMGLSPAPAALRMSMAGESAVRASRKVLQPYAVAPALAELQSVLGSSFPEAALNYIASVPHPTEGAADSGGAARPPVQRGPEK